MRGGGCVLDANGAVDYVGTFSELPFTEGEWSHLSSWREAVCGVRMEDQVIVCHELWMDEGFELDWGPIRALDVRNRQLYNEVSLCAITERNEIRCHGDGFDEAFFEELEDLNDERRTPLPPELVP